MDMLNSGYRAGKQLLMECMQMYPVYPLSVQYTLYQAMFQWPYVKEIEVSKEKKIKTQNTLS